MELKHTNRASTLEPCVQLLDAKKPSSYYFVKKNGNGL